MTRFRFRLHRPTLKESLETIVFVSDGAALLKHLQRAYPELQLTSFFIKPLGYDPRLRWDTYIVTTRDGDGEILGFADGPL